MKRRLVSIATARGDVRWSNANDMLKCALIHKTPLLNMRLRTPNDTIGPHAPVDFRFKATALLPPANVVAVDNDR